MFELAGSRAVVTGTSQGIGKAVAERLAEAGAHVAGIYKWDPDGAEDCAERIRAAGREAIMIEGDTGDPAQVDALARAAADAWGGIDIWVNNAARLLVRPFLELSDDDWHGLLAANLHGYFYGCRAAARQMAAQGGGRIVNVTSIVNFQPVAELTAYATAKGAIASMTKSLGLELAPHGILVNAVAPGSTDTPLNAKAYTPEVRRTYESRIALGRIATAEEIADVVVFLCSTGSRYMTGLEILVDGGMVINGNVGHVSGGHSGA